jgi:hypothetical protein
VGIRPANRWQLITSPISPASANQQRDDCVTVIQFAVNKSAILRDYQTIWQRERLNLSLSIAESDF